MTLRSEWAAIAVRMDGFATSTSVYRQTLVSIRDDPYSGADNILLPDVKGDAPKRTWST